MREEAMKILLDLVKKASQGIDSAVSFSQAQIPDVISQLLIWNFIQSVIFNAIALALIVACVWAFKVGYKKGVQYFIPLTPEQLEENRKQTYESLKHKREEWIDGAGFMRNEKNELSESFIVMLVAFAAVAIASAFLINMDFLKIWIAPKLYLIEYAASIVK